MSKWFLILSLLGDHPYAGHAVAQVGPFASQEQCMVAAKEWVVQIKQARFSVANPRTLCVRSDAQ